MKRLGIFVLAAALAACLSACGQGEGAGMSIKPRQLSQETREVLEIFEDEVQFYTISWDDTAKYEKLSVWICRDGRWQEEGQITGEMALFSGQIAVRLTQTSCDVYVMDESGHTKYSYPLSGTEFTSSMLTGAARIEEETPIQLGQEVPIWVKVGTEESAIRTVDLSGEFRELDCDGGLAVTLTISDREFS